jgi:hypothetical protein
MTETVQETSGVLTSAVPAGKELNAESVTAMSANFLKRIGYKGGIKPKRVSLEGDLYTVELEMSKFTATVKVDVLVRKIKEYDVQPKSEESALATLSPKTLIMMVVVSSIVTVGLSFAFKILGL